GRAEERAAPRRRAPPALAGARAELAGVEARRPASRHGLRLGDVITAHAGFEAALSAVLGPLVDAIAAPDEETAMRAISGSEHQTTALYPAGSPVGEPGSLYDLVDVRDGYAEIARRLLGGVVVGRDVTRDGVYRASGIVRAGSDPRTAL